MKLRVLGAVALGVMLGMSVGTGTHNQSVESDTAGWFELGISKAYAQRKRRARNRRQNRRVARRTSRRTARRVARRTSIAGCRPWRTYWNCGGVYYAAVVEGGTTVYVVVNP